MRHMIRGRQLSRDTEHRLAMRRNLVQSLFEHGKVRTTHPKAKEVKAFAEKLITIARENTVNARRKVISLLHDRRLVDENQEFIPRGDAARTVVQRLFKDIAPRFLDRTGGYTRIIKLSDFRIGDGGDLVILQILTDEAAPTGTVRRSAGLRRKRNERRRLYASRIAKRGTKTEAVATGDGQAAPSNETPAAGA